MLIAVGKSSLGLCDQGEYKAAAEMAGLRVGEWPKNVSGGDYEHAEALLVAGIISTVEGGIRQTGDQSVAREMFIESIRLFGDDPKSWIAKSWLARAYYWDGETDRALELAEKVLSGPIDSPTRFRTLLTRASIYSDQGLSEQAFAELKQMEAIYESLAPLLKGQFHNQRGRVLRLMNETDRAIVEYDAAISFFEETKSVRCQAIAANNLAGVYLETEQFAQAHEYAIEAQRLFQGLGDKTYEAKAWDQIAQIYLADGKLDEAEVAIQSGISLVEFGNVLGECKETADKIKNRRAIESVNERAKICPTSPSLLQSPMPRERSIAMTPLHSAMHLMQNPQEAAMLYDLIVWLLSARDDPQHEAEIDEIEEAVYSRTPDCERHRESYRRSRLVREVTSDS